MNILKAKQKLLRNAEAGNSTLLVSGSGMGKSQICYQAFREFAAARPTKKCGYGQIFAATQTPPDLIGYQFKGEKQFDYGNGEIKTLTVTDPSVPLWMISDEGKPAFMYDYFWLTIDEYGQGEAETKRALAEILLNGGTSPWYLPPGSPRVAASNEGSRYGVTKDFDFCISRRTKIVIVGDVEVTVNHWDKNYFYQGETWQVSPFLKAWAHRHPEILFETEPKEQGPWCNPRTALSVDRYLQVEARHNNGAFPTDSDTLEVVAGTVGMAAASSIIGDLQFRIELPSYDEVIADPSNTPVPSKADLMLLMTYELAGHCKVEHLAECLTYMKRLAAKAKDMEVTFISALLRRDYKGVISQPAMQAWISKNANLVTIIASLAQ